MRCILKRISLLVVMLYEEMIKPPRNRDVPLVVEPMSNSMLSISLGCIFRRTNTRPNSGAHTIGLAKLLTSPFQINAPTRPTSLVAECCA
jgi:hypothetical protein